MHAKLFLLFRVLPAWWSSLNDHRLSPSGELEQTRVFQAFLLCSISTARTKTIFNLLFSWDGICYGFESFFINEAP